MNTSTPPPASYASSTHSIPSVPHLPSPASSSRHRPRSSINSSFSFGPQQLADSFHSEANSSTLSHPYSSFAVITGSPLRGSPRRKQKKPQKDRAESSRHPLANDTTTDIFQDSDDDADDESDLGDGELPIIDRMRLWRQEALMQHLYDTAAHWADKILTWTNDPNDAFWLAQTYFWSNQYARAERLLTRPWSLLPPASAQPPALNGDDGPALKGKSRIIDEPKSLAPYISRLPMGPGGLIEVPEEEQETTSRLVDVSLACRYLCAQCQMRQGNWTDALEMLGDTNPFREPGKPITAPPAAPNLNGISIEASMCHLRGMLMLKLNRGDHAKQCFMEALAIDVKCYSAFEQLINNEMMTPEEEWNFIQSLPYASQTPGDGGFVGLIYQSRLRKNAHAEEHRAVRQRLIVDFGMGDNPDVLFSVADALYNEYRWEDCHVVTTRILQLVTIHTPTLPLHIACMYHLKPLHSKLFILAHELVDKEPENPLAWYAVGVWYLGTTKWGLARQYFSKTSLMDPRFGPAWIAFGHTFALEGEHDHAVVAYSTCARMFTGSHLPLTFVGMEQLMLANNDQAEESLNAAQKMCATDPLLMNERGVMLFGRGEYEEAAELFQRALDSAKVTNASQKVWGTTFLNLGTCHRKLGNLPAARKAYDQVLLAEPRHPQALAYLGIVNHLDGRVADAILNYHEALSIDPINPHVLELLNMALETSTLQGVNLTEEWEHYTTFLKGKWERLGAPGSQMQIPSIPGFSGDSGDLSGEVEMSVG